MTRQFQPFQLMLRLTVALVSITFIVWGYQLLQTGQTGFGVALFVLALLILGGGSYLISRVTSQIAAGTVLHDELSTHLLYKSGYIAWIASTLVWVFIGSFIDDINPPRYGIYIGLLITYALLPISYLIVKSIDLGD